MKYHYSYRRFTYPMMGGTAAASSEVRVLSDFETRSFSDSSDKRASARPTRLETPVRWGVWLGGGPQASKSRT